MPLPQRSLYAGLLVTSLVVTAALVWSGCRLVAQQRELDGREVRQQAEATADALAADIRDALAGQSDQLSARLVPTSDAPAPPAHAVIVTWSAEGGRVEPAGGLPFVPWEMRSSGRRPSLRDVFAEAEAAEFGAGTSALAVAQYRSLSRRAEPSIRAGALLRLARVLRARGDTGLALAAAAELVALGDQNIDGVPASLAGLDVQRLAFADRGDTSAARRAGEEIRQRLDRGVWTLDRGTAEFYRDEVSDAPRPDAWVLARALSTAWQAHGGPALSDRGVVVLASADTPVIVAWRATASVAALHVAFADQLLSSVDRPDARWRLTDADDRRLAGVTDAIPEAPVSRVIGGGSAWTLRVWPAPPFTASHARREPMLIAGTAGTVLFVWAAAVVMARALARDAQVAQRQSDFVAAVSHEFRSPLTTMRQMTEMLETDRVPEEARRKQYYHVLAGETARLQRLVERLLDFGRMEAGHGERPPERLDVAVLVGNIMSGMADLTAEQHARVEIIHAARSMHVRGDPDALCLAVRNLVENALKYSPDHAPVTVTLGREATRAVIAVRDRGAGIERDEQVAIFGKFVRGRTAAAGPVRGTGVGLAVVKHVVEAHGGEVRLQSSPGRGSTFTVLLPLEQPPAPEAMTSSSAEESEA